MKCWLLGLLPLTVEQKEGLTFADRAMNGSLYVELQVFSQFDLTLAKTEACQKI